MDIVTTALTREEISAIEARQATAPEQKPAARQILPAEFEGERTVRLAVPVEFNGVTYDAANIRRLKGKDFMRLKRMRGEDEDTELLSIITGIPVEAIGELDADDFMTLLEVTKDFLPQALAASGSTSASGLRS